MARDSSPLEMLGTHAERREIRFALWAAGAVTFVALVSAAGLAGVGASAWLTVPSALLVGWVVYRWLTRRVRRRRLLVSQPFPAEWEAVLQQDVVFYRSLDESGRTRFRRELQVFLGEKRITGIKTTLDTTTRVLAGASAIIPIFGFPDWEWDQISEVLVYPGRFGMDFGMDDEASQNTLGMVGTGVLNRVMVLSKPDLVQGFRNPGDKRNVGLHEFAHLVDKSDGSIDGVPQVGLDRGSIGPWIELMRRKMAEIEEGESDLNPYALTNEAEFFAVATEYLFERPGLMRQKHPELFAALQKIFNQNLGARLGVFGRERKKGPRRFGRNSPCPCGSGKKFKKCCLPSES